MDIETEAAIETQVVIVGGGPVGLTMALLLESVGIDFFLFERRTTTTNQPKARMLVPRTMEIFRQLGVAEAVRNRGMKYGSDIVISCESLVGREIGRTKAEPHSDATPEWKCVVGQVAVESELLRAAVERSSDRILFGTEVVDIQERNGEAVIETMATAGGSRRRWIARYVIAADGASSATRTRVGIQMSGPDLLARQAYYLWRGDLADLPFVHEAMAVEVIPPDLGTPVSTLLNGDARDLWVTSVGLPIAGDERPIAMEADDAAALIRAQIGLPQFEVELVGSSIWRMSSQVAEVYRNGCVFLVGDAAHRIPPTGGFGLNTGVQDAHNLAWKLGLVIHGCAGEGILDSYETERRPVAQSNADWSAGNARRRLARSSAVRSGDPERAGFWFTELEQHFHTVGRALGYAYEEGAVIADGTVAPDFNSRYYAPTDRPGARFPHLWLDRDRKISTLDWVGRDCVLVAGPEGHDWLAAGAQVARRRAFHLRFEKLPNAATEQGFHIGAHGALLVRPDGHVAWRVGWRSQAPENEMSGALSELLD